MGSLLNVLTYSSDEAASVGVLMFIILMFVLVVLIYATRIIFYVIGHWKLFEKAGEDGWKALIPFYNLYTKLKIIGINVWWTLIAGMIWLFTLINCIFDFSDLPIPLTIILMTLTLFMYAISIYYNIILSVSTARSYGKSTGWAVGMFLFRYIFPFALGVSKAEYVGATPMNDPVMGLFTGGNKSTSKKAKFCGECGAKIDKNAKFCPKCGKKI